MREELKIFTEALESRLNAHQKKKGDAWKVEDPSILRQRIVESLQEYNDLIGECCPHCGTLLNDDRRFSSSEEVMEKLEDVANNIMFLWCEHSGLLYD